MGSEAALLREGSLNENYETILDNDLELDPEAVRPRKIGTHFVAFAGDLYVADKQARSVYLSASTDARAPERKIQSPAPKRLNFSNGLATSAFASNFGFPGSTYSGWESRTRNTRFLIMEMTLILLKPDCFKKNIIGDVINRFERSSFTVCGCKMLKLSKELLEEHYAHIAQKPFFGEVLAYMQSTPVIALAIRGEDCIRRVRELVGPTDSRKAEKGTIRGDLGEDNMRNVVHASDSIESAGVELKRFFQDGEILAE